MSEKHWAVTVSVNGSEVVTIESNCLSGVENVADHEDSIETAARHLLSFIGKPDALPPLRAGDREEIARAILQRDGDEIFDDDRMWKSAVGQRALAYADAILSLHAVQGESDAGQTIQNYRRVVAQCRDLLARAEAFETCALPAPPVAEPKG